MDSSTSLTPSRPQLKALPKKRTSSQLLWVNRGRCGGILIETLQNEPTDLYIPDPLSNGSNYQSLMLEFPGMGLSSQTETDTGIYGYKNVLPPLLNPLYTEYLAIKPHPSGTAGDPSYLWDQALSI